LGDIDMDDSIEIQPVCDIDPCVVRLELTSQIVDLEKRNKDLEGLIIERDMKIAELRHRLLNYEEVM
jgi:hypothetical protein